MSRNLVTRQMWSGAELKQRVLVRESCLAENRHVDGRAHGKLREEVLGFAPRGLGLGLARRLAVRLPRGCGRLRACTGAREPLGTRVLLLGIAPLSLLPVYPLYRRLHLRRVLLSLPYELGLLALRRLARRLVRLPMSRLALGVAIPHVAAAFALELRGSGGVGARRANTEDAGLHSALVQFVLDLRLEAPVALHGSGEGVGPSEELPQWQAKPPHLGGSADAQRLWSGNGHCDRRAADAAATGCAKHHEYALPPGPASYALRHGREAPAPAAPVGHAIHVVGPDLRVGAPTWDGAVAALATAYRNALAEFDASELPTLRLLPISGGIFAGAFRKRVPRLTREALDAGFAQLPEATQQRLLSRELELCIFAEAEFEGFVRVGFHPDAGYAEANS